MTQYKREMKEIPFRNRGCEVRKDCVFLVYNGRNYFCDNPLVRKKASQMSPDYQLLEKCCNIFVKQTRLKYKLK